MVGIQPVDNGVAHHHDLIPGHLIQSKWYTHVQNGQHLLYVYTTYNICIYIYITYILCIYSKVACYILVDGIPTPLNFMSSSVGMMTFPTEWKNKNNFQSTNQYTYNISLFSGPLLVLNLQFKRINPLITWISFHNYSMISPPSSHHPSTIVPTLSHNCPIILKLLTSIVIP